MTSAAPRNGGERIDAGREGVVDAPWANERAPSALSPPTLPPMINCFLNFVPLLPHEQLTPPEFRLGDGLGADEQLLFRSLRRLTSWLLLVFLWLASNDVLFGLSTDCLLYTSPSPRDS